jgi:hypothetical protein
MYKTHLGDVDRPSMQEWCCCLITQAPLSGVQGSEL